MKKISAQKIYEKKSAKKKCTKFIHEKNSAQKKNPRKKCVHKKKIR